LCRTETIGPISFFAMLRRFGSARAALDMLPQLARRSERSRTVTAVTRAEAETELAALHKAGARLIC
jgi:DNA processing protein